MSAQLRLVVGDGGYPVQRTSVEYRAREFYDAYPLRKAWGDVVRAYPLAERIALAELRAQGRPIASLAAAHQAIMEGLANYQWQTYRGEVRYPSPATWLRGRRWMDEAVPETPTPLKSSPPRVDERSARIAFWIKDWRDREAAGWCQCGSSQCRRTRAFAESLLRRNCSEAWDAVHPAVHSSNS